MPKKGSVRKANRRANKMAEGLHGRPIPVSEQLQEQLTGVVNGIDVRKPEPLDIGIVGRAVKERWPVDERKRPQIVDRLMKVLNKETVSVLAKGGVKVEVDLPADINAVAAARVLVAMEGQNQSDEHHSNPRPAPGNPSTAVQVNVVNTNAEPTAIQQPSRFQSHLQTVLDDPDLIELRRRRALECDAKPSIVRTVGQSGNVESSPSSNGNRSPGHASSPGSVNGNGNPH